MIEVKIHVTGVNICVVHRKICKYFFLLWNELVLSNNVIIAHRLQHFLVSTFF